VCNRQLVQLRSEAEAGLRRMNAAVLVIDGHEIHRTRWWQRKLELPWPILADPAARVQGVYGVARQLVVHDEWVNAPAAFVVDRGGVLTFAQRGHSVHERPAPAQLLAEVAKVA